LNIYYNRKKPGRELRDFLSAERDNKLTLVVWRMAKPFSMRIICDSQKIRGTTIGVFP
jgi:hypothetical protein